MFGKFFKKLKYTFILTNQEKQLYKNFDVKSTGDINIQQQNIILLQCIEDYYYFALFGLIVKGLKNDQVNKFTVMQYVPRNSSVGASKNLLGILKSFLLYNGFRDNKWIKLYSSYCAQVAFRNEGSTSLVFNLKAFFEAYKIFKTLKTKDNLVKLKIMGITVGDLIYDSYLRYKPAATVDLKDTYLLIVIWQTLRNIKNATDFFQVSDVKILLTSYSSYIQHGVVTRIALQHRVKVFSFGDYGLFYSHLTTDYWFHTKDCRYYKNDFNKISSNVKLDLSRKALADRFNGKIDLATSYMKESAYKKHNIKVPNVKNKVVIFLHDFFDSPHIYKTMLFPDFYEWFEKTIQILNNSNIDYYIKEHPNQINDSALVVAKLKKQYKDLKFLSNKITNKQLVENGIIAGISVYGTVAHELAYLGIPVVLCGDNPHSSYDFTFEAKSLSEYTSLLENIYSLKLPINTKYQVESFYYMHNLNYTPKMLELLQLMKELRDISSITENLNLQKWDDILNRMSENIEFKIFIQDLKKQLA